MSPSRLQAKSQRAYTAGFFAQLALSTGTPYRADLTPETEKQRHWVVFYRHTPSINRRLTDRKSFEVAITVEDNCVWESFETLTELTIFCAGAGVYVPQLDKWISPW